MREARRPAVRPAKTSESDGKGSALALVRAEAERMTAEEGRSDAKRKCALSPVFPLAFSTIPLFHFALNDLPAPP